MRGFRSHSEETTFDFTDRSLVAIVGPTGAGKSTILDGISYALYAKTPREKRNSKNLVSTRAKKARITYRFALGPDSYEINRSIPAASDDHMVTIETGDKAVGSTAITAKVEELLGLDFDGFASSVLLAQGRFDLFLKATTKERTGILKGIFRIERIDELRKAAVARRDGIDTELARIEGEFKQIPADADRQLADKKTEVSALEKRIADLKKAMPEEAGLLESEKEAAREKADAEAEIVALTDTVTRLPSVEHLEELSERETDCAASVKQAAATLESCTKAADTAEQDLEKLQMKFGTAKTLHSARAKAEDATRLEEDIRHLTAELGDLKNSTASAQAKVDETGAAEAKAKEAVEDSRRALEELKRIHTAHELRTTLEEGAPCPVCEQEVATIPRTGKTGDVGKAAAVVASGESDLEKARAATVAAKQALATEQQRERSALSSRDKANEVLAEKHAAIERVIGKVTDPLTEIDDRLARLEQAVDAREAALRSRDEARRSLERCRATTQELDKQRQRHAGTLIDVAARLGIEGPSVEDPASVLIERVGVMTDRASAQGDELHARIEKAIRIVSETADAITKLRARAGIDVPFSDAIADAQKDVAVARHVIEDLTVKLGRANELNELEARLRARRALFHQLADDLTDRHFVNFLLEDRRRLLSELASERLHEMTRRYRFSHDGEFDIVDELEGDVVRGADTLSGGETFLASLALALGLAETATRHGGRLQSFFLDEGFDSLDAEMLDLALDGIERIVSPDRLIALVSHVSGLAARVEDKIELGKNAEGQTVLLAGASR